MEVKKYKMLTNCFCKNNKIDKNKIIYKSKPKKETDFKIKKKNYLRAYHQCQNCHHFFANHNYDLEKLYKKYYSSLTYGSQQKIKNTFNKIIDLPIHKSDNKYRVKRVMKIIKKNYKCLDIGSGLGVFPYELKRKKILVECLEKDKNLKNHLKLIKLKTVKLSILKKNFRNKFDFISFNKVIEHIQKPDIFVRKFLNLLKFKGYLYIEVPSIKALNNKLGTMREEFFIEHFHVFSKKSTIMFLKNLKLEIIYVKDIVEKSGKYTLVALAKKYENF